MTNDLTELIPRRAGRRQWLGLGAMALACLLCTMDFTVLHLALPALSADLDPTGTELLWIIDIYGFVVAGCLITMGSLGDRIGRRRLLLIGAAAFGCASVAVAYSTSAEMLIAARAVLGIAAATVAPSTLSLIRTMFPDDDQRRTAVGIWITGFVLGGIVGPTVGGLMLEYFWWGSVFLINVPVMVAFLVLGPRILPESNDPSAGRVDPASAALSLAAILALVFGLKYTAQSGLSITSAIAALVGCALAWIFVRRQRRLLDPLIDFTLFRIPAFPVAIFTYSAGMMLVSTGTLFLPQYRQLLLGMSPLVTGLWMVPTAVAFVVGTNLTPLLARRSAPMTLIAGGLVVAAVGFAALLAVDAGSGLWLTVIGPVVFALGMSPLFTLINDMIIAIVPPERAGAAAGVSETAAEVGGALGIAVFGSVAMAVYRRQVETVLPAGIPTDDADAARNTLVGAIEVTDRLPGDAAGRLLTVAQSAFTSGMHVAAASSAVVAVALATFAIAVGRRALSETKTLRQ